MVERTVVERTVVERTVVERTVVETTSGGKHLSPLEAPGLHDTNLNILSTRTSRGQELLSHIKKAKTGKSK